MTLVRPVTSLLALVASALFLFSLVTLSTQNPVPARTSDRSPFASQRPAQQSQVNLRERTNNPDYNVHSDEPSDSSSSSEYTPSSKSSSARSVSSATKGDTSDSATSSRGGRTSRSSSPQSVRPSRDGPTSPHHLATLHREPPTAAIGHASGSSSSSGYSMSPQSSHGHTASSGYSPDSTLAPLDVPWRWSRAHSAGSASRSPSPAIGQMYPGSPEEYMDWTWRQLHPDGQPTPPKSRSTSPANKVIPQPMSPGYTNGHLERPNEHMNHLDGRTSSPQKSPEPWVSSLPEEIQARLHNQQHQAPGSPPSIHMNEIEKELEQVRRRHALLHPEAYEGPSFSRKSPPRSPSWEFRPPRRINVGARISSPSSPEDHSSPSPSVSGEINRSRKRTRQDWRNAMNMARMHNQYQNYRRTRRRMQPSNSSDEGHGRDRSKARRNGGELDEHNRRLLQGLDHSPAVSDGGEGDHQMVKPGVPKGIRHLDQLRDLTENKATKSKGSQSSDASWDASNASSPSDSSASSVSSRKTEHRRRNGKDAAITSGDGKRKQRFVVSSSSSDGSGAVASSRKAARKYARKG